MNIFRIWLAEHLTTLAIAILDLADSLRARSMVLVEVSDPRMLGRGEVVAVKRAMTKAEEAAQAVERG